MRHRYPIQGWREELISRMPGGRVTLTTDISQFYPSIYTHAVDWSIRGKNTAKKNFRFKNGSIKPLGAMLDARIRESRGGQTIGLSIGPDTSWLIAEIVLGGIDRELSREFPSATGRIARFGDDMTVYAKSRGEADDILAHYQRALLERELSVNPTKVSINDGIEPIYPSWLRKLRSHLYRDDHDRNMRKDIIGIFDTALELVEYYPNDGVLNYAIKRCNPFPSGSHSWATYLDFLLVASTIEPTTLPNVAGMLSFANTHGLRTGLDRTSDTLNEAALQHARFNHGFEVSWILHIIRDLNLTLDSEVASTVAKMEDNVSLVILLDFWNHQRNLQSLVDIDAAVQRAERPGALSTKDWLLAYEYRHRRVCKPRKWDDSAEWKSLHDANVTFYTTRPHARKVKRTRPSYHPAWQYGPDL